MIIIVNNSHNHIVDLFEMACVDSLWCEQKKDFLLLQEKKKKVIIAMRTSVSTHFIILSLYFIIIASYGNDKMNDVYIEIIECKFVM